MAALCAAASLAATGGLHSRSGGQRQGENAKNQSNPSHVLLLKVYRADLSGALLQSVTERVVNKLGSTPFK